MDSDRRGATLVIGPAGTGKTTWLRRRNAELIDAGETGILFLVPNRSAARALQESILRDVGRSTVDVRVQTWHGFALSVLSLYHEALGYEREPALLTGPEQFALVREMLGAESERAHWAPFRRQLSLSGFVSELREFVLRAQDAMESPETLAERARLARRDDLVEAAGFFGRYLAMLDARSFVDAANAIALTVNLLESQPEVAADVRRQTRHLLVDDYQDVTPAQERLLRALFAEGGSVAAAADPGARIFGFRGAADDAAEAFRRDFAPVAEVVLDTCHRGEPARAAWLFDHLTEEAEAIARETRRLHAREGIGWGNIAVLVRRYGGASRAIRRAFERGGVPYVVVGENRPLAAEPALRPMLDLARAALRPAELEELLPGLLSSPVIGVDPYDVRALRREARLRGASLTEMLQAPPPELPERLRAGLEELRALLELVRERDGAGARPDEVFFTLWERLPMFRAMVAEGDQEALDAVAAFSRAADRFSQRRADGASFDEFLDVLEGIEFGPEPWNMPHERRPHAVRIMTAHHAVGAEFAAVFVAGCVEGAFPDVRAPHPMLDLRDLLHPTGPFERLQERLGAEGRLFGVATSRARAHLVLTAARESSQREALTPSPLVTSAGLEWSAPAPAIDALTRAEAVTAARRALRDAATPEAARADALDVLARLPGVDPHEWWFERDWTDPGPVFAPDELMTSYSRLNSYENCPLQYLYQVELGLDPETSHAMQVGTWIHDIVDKAGRGDIERTEEALHAALEEVWDPTIFEGPAIEHRRKRDCRLMLRAWLACDGDLDTLASEVDFNFGVDGARVRGRIDRLVRLGRSMVRVIDYKTSRSRKPESELPDDLQLAIYNLAMFRDPTLAELGTPKILELAFLGTVWGDGTKFMRSCLDPTKLDGYAEATEEKLRTFVADIKAERFEPNADADCQWCSFKTLCPVWPEGDEVTL